MEKTRETLNKNGLMFFYAREYKPTAVKIKNIEKILIDGAYINFTDANDKKNTILHIATELEEKDVVEFLLQKGALLIMNLDNKTPLQIAEEKNTEVSKEILNILTKKGKHFPRIDVSRNLQRESYPNRSISQNNDPTTPTEAVYKYKIRKGTSGATGQLYETKLLSLVLHRALHDNEIEECYLATNINDIGDFDDICYRFQMQEDGKTKHVMCFIQAKHREDLNKTLSEGSLTSDSGDFSLIKYFDSYLKIKQKFVNLQSAIPDPMFKGEFNDIDCYFILYTPLKRNENFVRIHTKNKPVHQKLHDFIDTGDKKEDIFQFKYEISEIKSLTNFMQQGRIKALGKHFLTCILSGKTSEIMNNDLMKIYHPALAQNVIEITGREPNLKGKFRKEFFDSDDDLLLTLKVELYELIVMKQTKKTKLTKEEVKEKIKDIVNNPCAQTISTLIGEVILFCDKSNKLFLEKKKIDKSQYETDEIHEMNYCLQKCQVLQAEINDAINIIGKNKLESLTFKLPHNFGNSDFPKLRREDIFAEKIYLLMNDAKLRVQEKRNDKKKEDIKYPMEICIYDTNFASNLIPKDRQLSVTEISRTVGNLLQFDKEKQSYIFNTNEESLGENTKNMLNEIRKLTQDDLALYKIYVKINNFPRTSFEANKNDEELVEDYLNKLWLYTNQANEEAVENILKKEIDLHYNIDKRQNQFLFQVHSDAIYLRFHDEIQKWWKSQSQARYLTKTDTIFDEAKKDIINSPILTVLNFMFIRSLKRLDIEFDADAINSMDLEKRIKNKKILNILSAAVILSANKLMQSDRLRNNYTFINLDYVHVLPENEKNQLMNELSEMKAVTLVIICETSLDERHQNTINEIIKIYKQKIIIITDILLQEKIYQNNDYIVFNDENINLNNLNHNSQSKVLKEFKVCYQGEEVTLESIIDDNSKTLIHTKMLWSLLNKVKIEIGQAIDTFKYDEIKDCYVNRSLLRDDKEYEVNTLNSFDDKIVLITSLPCMGKTILLTHLSLETKKIDPKPWIVQINMSAHNNDFARWKPTVTHVMRFLCKSALKTIDTIQKLNFTESIDRTVLLNRDNIEDVPFELEWFIHFYNQGNVILLFDGFDKIHPHFTEEGIELLRELKRANKQMWITSNCYCVHILEKELLEDSYKLERLSTKEQESILRRFWKTNLKLEKLNHEQCNNISVFINYVMKLFNCKSDVFTQERPVFHLLSIPLHLVYLTAVNYFKNEMNSLSPQFLREVIKEKWRLNSYTPVDRFLRNDDEDTLELAGTPLHMYIAANYFKLKITDEFKLSFDEDAIITRANVYINAITSYELFLKNNIKHICEIKNRNIEKEQDKLRDEFRESHKKLALYAICKESDIYKLLTKTEISEVNNMIKKIESGEMKTPFIDSVVDGIPQFYNLIFAEYFIVEFASDLIKCIFHKNMKHLRPESLWDFIVNGILTFCPPGVRNAFDYKLKYDPELVEAASNEKTNKIIFELFLKQKAKSEFAGRDAETCLNVAISEGLVNITNLLLISVRRYVTKDNVDGILSILKSSAFILGAVKPSWKEHTVDVMRCIDTADGQSLIEIINSNEMEGLSETLASFYTSTDMGQELQEKIKKEICEPIQQLTENLVELSEDNENLTKLVDVLRYNLPEIVNSLTGQSSKEDEEQGTSYEP